MNTNGKKWALVTGAGRQRVGFHVARALGQRGYSLVLHYRTSAREAAESAVMLEQEGLEAILVQADLAEEKQVDHVLATLRQRCGRLDTLVTCASTWQSRKLEQTTAADYLEAFRTNVLSTALIAQKAGLWMTSQPTGGNIVTVGDWAITRPYPEYAAYHTSKGSIPTLTRALAVELGRRNPKVRVNCVEPGPVMLPADLSPSERAEAIGATLVQREGTPEHVAQAVLSLVENDFITGVCLPVDGGRSIWALNR
ncbi:MAG: SDR family NAD(P)-dependent oxidoreductase [Gemmataceae bacterium]